MPTKFLRYVLLFVAILALTSQACLRTGGWANTSASSTAMPSATATLSTTTSVTVTSTLPPTEEVVPFVPVTDMPTFAPTATSTPIVSNASPTPGANCTATVIALDPGNGVQYTPSNVWVVLEKVDFAANTIEIFYFYSTSPVKAYIDGETHYNVWYGYCNEAGAIAGANSQYQERLSESSIPNGWAYGMSVHAPIPFAK